MMWTHLTPPAFARVAYCLSWIASWFIASDSPTPIVDLGYVRYQGFFDTQTNITSFLGVRYAAPPVGNLRFRAPHAPYPEVGVQPAMQNPSKCHQVMRTRKIPRHSISASVASEDCLFLNVFVPGTMSPEPITTGGLPVLIWFHGGGYHYGSAGDYNAAELLVDSLNTVVVVSVQYRLGLFGFLSGNEIKAHGALNAGLLDQDFALQWVQEHIGSFGGDKNHVTIWGESAGGGSVLQHIVAHGGNTRPPLFSAAMVSSAFLPPQYQYNHRVPQSFYNEVVSKTGCASSVDTFRCLQSVDSEALQTANHDIIISAFYPIYIFVPVVDGRFIVERPSVTLSKGRVNGQVLLAVVNQNEGNYSVGAVQTWATTQYVSMMFTDLTSYQVQEAASTYEGYGTPIEQAFLVYGDSMFVCPTYYLLKAFAGRSWKGLFAVPPAFHGDDLLYYYYSPNNPPPYHNKEFITAFSQSFMSLAKYYDVNTKFDPNNITPYWNEYIVDKTEMLFGHSVAGEPVVVPIQTDTNLLQRCAFWASVMAETAQ